MSSLTGRTKQSSARISGRKVLVKRKASDIGFRDAKQETLIENVANVFAVMGDPTRLKILIALMDAEHSVGELAEITHLSHSATSHQLRLLRVLRLVRFHRNGQSVLYSLEDEHIVHILKTMWDHLQEQ